MIPHRIEAARLLLRAADAGEGERINEAIRETFEQLRLWMPWARAVPSPEESRLYAQEAARRFKAQTQFDFSILRFDGAFVGRVGIWPLAESGAFEIGYWCRAGQQKRGYASESVAALSEAALKYLEPRRLIIRCDSRNIASQKVALRCGFSLRETRLGDAVANDGSVRDTLIFALSPDDAEHPESNL